MWYFTVFTFKNKEVKCEKAMCMKLLRDLTYFTAKN